MNTTTGSADQRSIFVAYAYTLYDRRDYRKVFTSLENAFGVKFIFADEKITNMHIMQKIISYIQAADFSIYDISGWNPNVTLELGIGIGIGMMSQKDWYILVNPEKTPNQEVPSDIKGIDRIQYTSFSDLEDRLAALLSQRYAKHSINTLRRCRQQWLSCWRPTLASQWLTSRSSCN
jgi:predicted nucleotide-binding protein